ncbi:hypothetical protein DH2020_019936 [Rehmannia glutinosa]|uniref:Uncharacterized protein n=1 Tax=Rehmannia glutinosa TaxID=99300 RepID=A0ABR0WIK1_REHGL
MALLLRRVTFLRSITNSLLSSQCSKFSTAKPSTFRGHERGHSVADKFRLSPLFSEISKDDMKDCKIEVVDDATWHVSSGLIDAWKGNIEDKALKTRCDFNDPDYNGGDDVVCSNKEDPNFDEIEDMRIRGNLFYKLDKDSKEAEEYKFDYHGSKFARKAKERKEGKEKKKKEIVEINSKKKDTPREIKKIKETQKELLSGRDKDKTLIYRLQEWGDSCVGKKQRTLTFNQLTAPTTNRSVWIFMYRRDMKFDLGSTKNRSACAAVGKVLAQRALADDIHNVVYTPRKGDKVEGKLQVVLNSIVDGGVDVKVKLKQKKLRQSSTRRSIPLTTCVRYFHRALANRFEGNCVSDLVATGV